jgi:D-amino-acid dehydrogenase
VARTDALVLGAGIVGTSVALQLARRGLAVALVDRRDPGEETSYGNTGVIGGSGILPTAFPDSLKRLIRIASKRAAEANYHAAFLPKVIPWLLSYRAASTMRRQIEIARLWRPLMGHALSEHEDLMQESDAIRYLRKDGLLSIYRTGRAFENLKPHLDLCDELGISWRAHDTDEARLLEPSLNPVFRYAVHWPSVASVSNPLGVTRAYAARFSKLGGIVLKGDARTLHRAEGRWRVDTAEGPVDAGAAVITLGPWAPDVLRPLGIDLPLAVKRGYHRHFRPHGNARLTRPLADSEIGYALSPMEQGHRLTTGAEFADRDAPPTPVQLDRLMPDALSLFPLGDPVEKEPWMGRRPCFADTLPVIGRAPRQSGLWLCYGHGHMGLTLGPASGRLIAEMMTDATPIVDPAPYAAERFGR